MGDRLTEKGLRGGVDKRGGGNAAEGRNGGRIGNPPHERTDAMANKVRMLRALGNNQEVIAFACDVSVDTLAKHYKLELELGVMEANARVGAAIFNTALGEKVPCFDCDMGVTSNGGKCKTCHATGEVWRQEPNTTAQIWWSKNRMGWTDRERIEHVGDGGGPIVTEQRDSGRDVHARLAAIRERQKLTDGSKGDA
jgi:hypothetical protein